MMTAKLAAKREPITYRGIADPVVQSWIDRKEKYFFALLLILAIPVALFTVYTQAHQVIPPKHEKVVVQAGDTLWSIAESNYGQAVDVRNAVDDVMQVNGIHDAGQLRVGQVLEMPIMK